MDEQTKKAKWEVVSLAKEIFADAITPVEQFYNKEDSTWTEIPFDEKYAKSCAINSIRAAEIFYEELAKKEGAV